RDDAHDAQRTPVGVELLARHLGRHGLAVQASALGLEELAGVDRFLNAASSLLVGLAHLARYQARERLLLALERLADLADELPTDGRGCARPGLEGFAGGLAGLAHLLLGRF